MLPQLERIKIVALRILKNILLFHKKIFFISYIISLIVALLLRGTPKTIGLTFLLIAPFIQYYFYELKTKNEYYYYYNLGITKGKLWLSTFVIGLINLLILLLL